MPDADPAVIDALLGRHRSGQRRLRRARRRGRRSPDTLDQTRREARRLLHGHPTDAFPTVAEALARSGLNGRGRIVVEKPFGRDLASAQRAERDAARGVPRGAHLPHRPLPRQGERRGPARLPLLEHVARADLEPQLRSQRAAHDGRDDRRRGSRRVLRLRRRDPRRRAEPPPAGGHAAGDGAAGRRPVAATCSDEKAKVLAAMEPIDRAERRARPVRRLPRRARRRSRLRRRRRSPPRGCEIDSWRWAGVPFYVRAGKALAATATEAVVEFQRTAAPAVRRGRRTAARAQPRPLPARVATTASRSRCRPRRPASSSTARTSTSRSTSPPRSASVGTPTSGCSTTPSPGNPRRFAREDVVEETWRMVQPALDDPGPIHPYFPRHVGPGRGRSGPAARRLLVHPQHLSARAPLHTLRGLSPSDPRVRRCPTPTCHRPTTLARTGCVSPSRWWSSTPATGRARAPLRSG